MDKTTIFWILQCFWGVIVAGAGFIIKRISQEIDLNRSKISELYKLSTDQGLKLATLTSEALAMNKQLDELKSGNTRQMEEMKVSLKELRDEMKETLKEIRGEFFSQIQTVIDKIELRNIANHHQP